MNNSQSNRYHLIPLLGVLTLFFLAACQNHSGSQDSIQTLGLPYDKTQLPPPALQPGDVASQEQALRQIFDLTCADPNNCSPSVGVGRLDLICTVFVVGPDLIQTARHCLTRKNAAVGSSCNENWFIFPRAGAYPMHGIRCKQIVDLSAPVVEGKSGVDYVIFRTEEPIGRPAIPINATGIPDHTELVTHYLESTGTLSGKIASQRCTSVMHSSSWSFYRTAFSPVVGLPKCDLKPGMSGGPAVDSAGHVRALIKTRFEHGVIKDGERIPLLSGHVSNMACVKSSVLRLEPKSRECLEQNTKQEHFKYLFQITREIMQSAEVKAELDKRFEDWKSSQGSSPFGWRLVFDRTDPQTLAAASEPVCVKPAYLNQTFHVKGLFLSSTMVMDDEYRYVLSGYERQDPKMKFSVDRTGTAFVRNSEIQLPRVQYDLPLCPSQARL